MTTYVLRRILLMVPTLFGVSFVVWLVMALSPGRPGQQAGGEIGDTADRLQRDAQKAASQNQAERQFRRQYGLDRPLFLNSWIWLETAEIAEAVRTETAPVDQVGAEAKREARETLEDWGYFYAVPALVDLLGRTSGAEQDHVLLWLLTCSQRPILPQSDTTPEELARYAGWRRENSKLKDWKWDVGAPPEERAPVVERWTRWFEENRGRWDFGGVEGVERFFLDTQFATYWSRLVRGDLGNSHIYKQPVGTLVLDRIKVSLSINFIALILSYMLAVPLGIFGAWKQGSMADRVIAVGVFALYSLPNFFVGTLLLKWLAAGEPFDWFPIAGFEGENTADMSVFEHFGDIVWHIALPLVCLTYVGLASLSRFSRSGMLDVIRSDYVRTARAKGLSEGVVILKHVVRNGILPIVTLLGTALPILITGSVAIEYIFNINGMGLLMINSIFQKDFNVVMGVQLMVAILIMIGILLSDLAYAILDPRISLQ